MQTRFFFIVALSLLSGTGFAKDQAEIRLLPDPHIADTILHPGNSRVQSSRPGETQDLIARIRLFPVGVIRNPKILPVDDDALGDLIQTYDLNKPGQLAQLLTALEDLLQWAQDQKNQGPHARSLSEISSESIANLNEMHNLAFVYVKTPAGSPDRVAILDAIRELAEAFNTNYRRPMLRRNSIGNVMQLMAPRGATRDEPTVNGTDQNVDLDAGDPQNSTFWTKPVDLAKKNFYSLGRAGSSEDPSSFVCEFAGPHTGYGVHPAYDVTCNDKDGRPVANGTKIKLKFGKKTHSLPFNARIFNALGFESLPYQYFPTLRVKYKREILSKFNTSRDMSTKLSILGAVLADEHLEGRENPFDYISYAIVKATSGAARVTIRGSDLAAQLLLDTRNLDSNIHAGDYHQLMEGNYNSNFESRIEYIVPTEGAYLIKNPDDEIEIGSWDYNDKLHARRRDLRGGVVLGAFLNNFDMRWDNTMSVLRKKANGSYELHELISDVGMGLGSANFEMFDVSMEPGFVNSFPRKFLERDDDPNTEIPNVTGIRFLNMTEDTINKTFDEINIQDVRWMARYISQITAEQFKAALIAAHFSSAEVRSYLAKLFDRRDNMLEVVGLQGQPWISPRGPYQDIDQYDPRVDGPMTTIDENGNLVTAPYGHTAFDSGNPDDDLIIQDGTVRRRH